jgi:alpha-galactosidase
MILVNYPYFHLKTSGLSYVFCVTPTKKLEHLYFGDALPDGSFEALHFKPTAGIGSAILYERDEHQANFDFLPMEFSEFGKGDYRLSPIELQMPDQTFVTDFIYHAHEIKTGIVASGVLPIGKPSDDIESLIITLKDTKFNVYIKLIYTVYSSTNMIGRRLILDNQDELLHIRKIMSMMMDIPEMDYELLTLQGGWIKETHKDIRPLQYGTYIHDSTTGASSNRVNPGFMVFKKGTHEDYGRCYGFNLIYSGNHYQAVHVSNHGIMRIMNGLHPQAFHYPLHKNEQFETPEAILSYSASGFNGLSKQFHEFTLKHITPRQFKHRLKPIVINSWEAFFFDFTSSKLLNLAKKAKQLGIELFVLDDGWFGHRDDDTSSLGDYQVNLKKLPGGLTQLSKAIHKLDMQFGLWFEPEMISPKSELYDKHPDWAVQIEGRTPSLGRNQWVLDLCNQEVRQYIIHEMSKIIESAQLDYIKWDMNRHITDAFSNHVETPGMFYHHYILGLYEILNTLQTKYPNLWIESCSSGGNRFDLGMLSYTPYIWASDNTDPIERLKIQEGLSYFYPPSTISAHVSLAPHAQTIRHTPLSTRFNVAAMACLGYELNLKYLTKAELGEIKKQISLYKSHQNVFQLGTFKRFNTIRNNLYVWQTSLADTHIVGFYQTLYEASPNPDVLSVKDLEPNALYELTSVQQTMPIGRFGHLIAHALPIKLNPNGFIMHTLSKYKQLENATESYTISGQALMKGIPLKQQFSGTYYNNQTRILGDFGSQLYIIRKVGEAHATD